MHCQRIDVLCGHPVCGQFKNATHHGVGYGWIWSTIFVWVCSNIGRLRPTYTHMTIVIGETMLSAWNRECSWPEWCSTRRPSFWAQHLIGPWDLWDPWACHHRPLSGLLGCSQVSSVSPPDPRPTGSQLLHPPPELKSWQAIKIHQDPSSPSQCPKRIKTPRVSNWAMSNASRSIWPVLAPLWSQRGFARKRVAPTADPMELLRRARAQQSREPAPKDLQRRWIPVPVPTCPCLKLPGYAIRTGFW